MPRIIFGVNQISEAIKSSRPPEKLFILHGTRGSYLQEVIALANNNKVLIEQVGRLRFTQLGGDRRAQGLAALISDYEFWEIEDIVALAKERDEAAFIALLDNIEDPRNLGAVIRSAEGLGVHGLIIPKHRAVGITETVASSSAGAMAHMAISRVTNLVNAIEELQEAGVWIVGLDHDAEQSILDIDLKGPIGVVMGSEGKGIRRLVKQKCDFLARIPMQGMVNSLNVSVAAAIFFYETRHQRGFITSEVDEIEES